MPFELKQWLTDLAAKGQLSAEDQALLEGKLSKPEVVKALEEGQLRQSDYDRKMNQLKKEHEDAMKGVTGLQTELTNWRTEAQAKLDNAMTELNAERSTRAQYEARIRQIATDYGLDPATLIPAANTPQPQPVATASPKPSPENDELKKRLEDFDRAKQVYPFLPAELHDLSVEHQELYGKPLPNTTKLVDTAMKEGRPIRDVWADQYKVEDRRKEIALENQKRHDEEIRADERKKIMSEQNVPTFRPDAPRSPIFAGIPQKSAPDAKAGELSAVDRATMAYDQAKYRQQSGA